VWKKKVDRQPKYILESDVVRTVDGLTTNTELQPTQNLPPRFCSLATTMGNRVKGKAKRKGIKAALASTAGSTRKLSRMGKKQGKDKSGLHATFLGRSKCLKLLQVTIKDFRRLCILKGIYPRDPIGKLPGSKGQTYYHVKDIKALAHEPLLEKFREFRAFMKKVRMRICWR